MFTRVSWSATAAIETSSDPSVLSTAVGRMRHLALRARGVREGEFSTRLSVYLTLAVTLPG